MIIDDVEFAKSILCNITYYRLSAYMKYFQIEDKFKTGTTFEDIINLYNFDKDLKSIIFENIRIIEISLRTKICLHMYSNYGSHWFYDSDNYKIELDELRMQFDYISSENDEILKRASLILTLCKNAYSAYLSGNMLQKRTLLKLISSHFLWDGSNLTITIKNTLKPMFKCMFFQNGGG